MDLENNLKSSYVSIEIKAQGEFLGFSIYNFKQKLIFHLVLSKEI